MWNCTSSTFCSSLREFNVPDLRLAKALSVGAKMVIPLLELFSWPSSWLATCVDFRRRMKRVNWPAFSRILVTFVGPEGAGAAATGVVGAAGAAAGPWAKVVEQWRTKSSRNERMVKTYCCFIVDSFGIYGKVVFWQIKQCEREEVVLQQKCFG
ncbi:hypothetical protein GQ457_12G026690 [Hibiscus cannabinus]